MKFYYKNMRGDFYITLQEQNENNMYASHTHDTYELYVLMEGNRCLFVRDSFFEVTAGNVFLVRPHVAHRTIASEKKGYVRLVCNFSEQWIRYFFEDARVYGILKNDVYITLPRPEDFQAILAAIREMEEALRLKSAGYEFIINATVLRILSVFSRYGNTASEREINTSSYERISGIVKYINKNYTEDISLMRLAERFYISEFYMCRLFKEYTGQTISAYINDMRIMRAKKLLTETGMKVSQISAQCGFGSLSNFNRAFKEQCGYPPMQYRSLHKAGASMTRDEK